MIEEAKSPAMLLEPSRDVHTIFYEQIGEETISPSLNGQVYLSKMLPKVDWYERTWSASLNLAKSAPCDVLIRDQVIRSKRTERYRMAVTVRDNWIQEFEGQGVSSANNAAYRSAFQHPDATASLSFDM